jgi:uncharacterized membrane protein
VGQSLGAALNPDQANMQQQMMLQQQMMMQQMMNQMNQQNQQNQQAAPAAPAGVPTTKEGIQAAIDALEMRFMNGEISEESYKSLTAKWQQKLDALG